MGQIESNIISLQEVADSLKKAYGCRVDSVVGFSAMIIYTQKHIIPLLSKGTLYPLNFVAIHSNL